MIRPTGRGGAAAVLVGLALSVPGCPAPGREPPPRTGADVPFDTSADAGDAPVADPDPPGDAVDSPSGGAAAAHRIAAPGGARGTPIQHGGASYYADRFTGRSTASGEPYDPRALTAAHRTLPFGAVVDIVRRDGRRVRVRINDRGPFARGKVIDLSRSAAEAIGLIHDGIAEVTLELVSRPPRRRK